MRIMKVHNVQSIQVDETYLHLTVDGKSYHIRLEECSPRLVQATLAQRQHVEVSPSGYGLHWPEIDEDLAITPLLQHSEALAVATN
jgi:hypothetical protein